MTSGFRQLEREGHSREGSGGGEKGEMQSYTVCEMDDCKAPL